MSKSKMIYKVKCPVCGKKFETHRIDKKFCSPVCRRAYWSKKQAEKNKLLSAERKAKAAKAKKKKEAKLLKRDLPPPIEKRVTKLITNIESETMLTAHERDAVMHVHLHVPCDRRWPVVKKWNARMKRFLLDLYKEHYMACSQDLNQA